MDLPERPVVPTLYFIGVTTGQSSIRKVFPLWAKVLGIEPAVLEGIDIVIHADAGTYRSVVKWIRDEPLALGALVTTHKIDLFEATADLFDVLDPMALRFGELSCISKRGGFLYGHAKDPVTSGLSLEAFVPPGYWKDHRGEVFIMGAGGSALAMSSYLVDPMHGLDVPTRITISNRSPARLEAARAKLSQHEDHTRFEFVLCESPWENDRVLLGISPYSLIVNATGLGKDRPGSPLTDACEFPEWGLIWEINYRGDLRFLLQAQAQAKSRNLHVEDGWIYFLHGWTQCIAEVFHMEIDSYRLSACETIARAIR